MTRDELNRIVTETVSCPVYTMEQVLVSMKTLTLVRSLIDGVIAKQTQLEAMQDLILRGLEEIAQPRKRGRVSNFADSVKAILGISTVNLSAEELLAVLQVRVRHVEEELCDLIQNLRRYNVRICRDGRLDAPIATASSEAA